jgi:hypothetical protein
MTVGGRANPKGFELAANGGGLKADERLYAASRQAKQGLELTL